MCMISVIIPTYNRASIINRAISSVQNQTYKNFEIIIVDDASTDNTREGVCSINDNRITYYKLNINSGGATARNKGIELSKGEFVAFLDSDDEWQPNMLESCLTRFQSLDSQNVIIFSKLLMDNKVTEKVFPESIYQGGDLSEYIFCQHGLVSTITLFMPQSVAKEVMFKEDLIKHQDYDFVLRAYACGIKFVMINKVLAIWHNEKRTDRMGVKVEYEESLEWLKDNENLFTSDSSKMFIKRDVINQVLNEPNKRKAINFFISLYLEKYLRVNDLIKYIFKSIIRGLK